MEPDLGKLPMDAWLGMISRKHAVEAMFASALTLQVYDWLLILPQEVEYIWRAPWNWSKVLYLLTRYISFAPLALGMRNQLAPNPSPGSCKRIAQVSVGPSSVAFVCVEIVLIVRTYAVWNRDKRIGIGLALLFILCQTATGIITGKWIGAANSVWNPYPEVYLGCIYNRGTRLVFANWVILSIEEGVDLVLMIVSAVNTCRGTKSNLMNAVYRDGIRFYLYIFCATLTNVLVTLLAPIDFVGIGSMVEIVLHSILACRLMIGIREASQSYGRKSETFELSEVPCGSTLVFARRPSGESAPMDLEGRAGASMT